MLSSSENFERSGEIRKQVCAHLERLIPFAIGKSEAWLSDSLQQALADDQTIYTDGWYQPPPHGIAILTSSTSGYSRLNFDTLRSSDYWPSTEPILNSSVVIIYVSPVCRRTLLLGDLGCTLYFGSDQKVRTHFELCHRVMRNARKKMEIGMEVREVHSLFMGSFAEHNLDNLRTVSLNDPAKTNIGHTIPFSGAPEESQRELSLVDNADWFHQISFRRKFISSRETALIPREGGFTIEASLVNRKDRTLPSVLVYSLVYSIAGKLHFIDEIPRVSR